MIIGSYPHAEMSQICDIGRFCPQSPVWRVVEKMPISCHKSRLALGQKAVSGAVRDTKKRVGNLIRVSYNQPMSDKPKKPKKIKVTLSITLEAYDLMYDNGYASERTMGEFISRLIVDYHYREGRGRGAPRA
jgi:hypothetical protein